MKSKTAAAQKQQQQHKNSSSSKTGKQNTVKAGYDVGMNRVVYMVHG